MRKFVAILLSASFLTFLVACGGEKVDDETASQYINEAEEIILLVNEGKYGEVTDAFADELKAELTEDELREIEPVMNESGDFEAFDKSSVEKDDGYYTVVISGKYTEDDRIFTISFNEDEELVGFFVK